MRYLLHLALLVFLMTCAAVYAQSSQDEPNAESLSTELSGIDSLDIAPKELLTPYQGGVRRVPLENTFFRRETPYVYSADGRRDPFRALVTDGKRDGEIKTDLLIIDGAVLTGVVWAEGHYLAMIRDKEKRSFFLREGDAIYKGRITSVTQTYIVAEISDFGEYRQVTLKVND